MDRNFEIKEDWKKKLTPEQYRVLRERATEPAFGGKLLENKEKGMYFCAGCGNKLFSSKTKFDSGSGWPSFWDVVEKENVVLKADNAGGMRRMEVVCAKCGSHLGHVFEDAPHTTTGKRYCINSCALEFKKRS